MAVAASVTVTVKPTLLVVEDDERIRYIVTMVAERSGHFAAVLAAPDGRAALELIRAAAEPRDTPMVVLTDLSMPRMDGLQMTRELKARPETRHLPVVMMTSSNRPNDREDAVAAGCCAFFEKPLRFDDFATLLATLPQHCAGAHPTR